jgi:apolipoprotein N-acyltransferase
MIGGSGRTRGVGALVLGVLIALVVFGNAARSRVTFDQPNLRVAIAQGNISQREKWTPSIFEYTLATYADLTRAAKAGGAKLVVWPETAVTSYPLQDPTLLKRLEGLASSTGVFIIAGTVDRPSADGYYNALIDLGPDGTLGGVYHKRFLVPFAEYLPLDRFLRAIPLLDNASRFVAGGGPVLLPAAGYRWGALICYESAFAQYARQTADAGADAIIVATDDAWFGGTSGPNQHADVAVIDAVSTGRWIVRGADTGISEIVDPKGNIIASLPIDQKGIVIGDIGRGFDTPYDRYGIGWLFGAAFLALVAGIVRRKELLTGWRSKRGKF